MMRAIRVNDLAKAGPFGRTTLFSFIKLGLLPARKIGGVTFVLEDDWRAMLESAPLAAEVGPNSNDASGARLPA